MLFKSSGFTVLPRYLRGTSLGDCLSCGGDPHPSKRLPRKQQLRQRHGTAPKPSRGCVQLCPGLGMRPGLRWMPRMIKMGMVVCGIPVHPAKLTPCDTEKCRTTVGVCRYDGFSCPEVLTSKPPPPSPPCEPWTKVQQLWYIFFRVTGSPLNSPYMSLQGPPTSV